MEVDCFGDQLFSGTALACYEDSTTAWSNLRNEVEDLPHLLAVSHNVFESIDPFQLGFQVFVFLQQRPLMNRLVDGEQHNVVFKGLGDVIERTVLHAFDRILEGSISGYHDDGNIGIHLPQFLEGTESADAIHHDIQNDGVIFAIARQLQRFFAGGDEIGLKTFGF